MATLQDLSLQDLPELVRDSHLEATFHPNTDIPNETTHLKYQGRGRPQQEKWIRQKILGRGGFGIVWLEKRESESPTAYNFRAVKQLDIAKIRSKRRDCVRELEALAKFSQEKYSRFFVKSYGWFQGPSALFLAMEYCELGDLKDHVEEHGELTENHVQDIGWQILQGLQFMHDNNFAHRDLKPANILIKNKPPYGDWRVKICDLGLSKRIGTDAATSTVQGTPGFMPPESVPGIGLNPRHIDPFPADMWCLGETIFYLLTRKRTFGGNLLRLREYWKGGPFPKEPLLRVRASDAAISFVKGLMARVPARRLTAEMAGQHELMKTEPFQEAEQETRESFQEGENPSAMSTDDLASGRWTTGTSFQQSLRAVSGSRGLTTVEPQRDIRAGQVPSSAGKAEFVSNDTGLLSPIQRPTRRGTNNPTQNAGGAISLSDSLLAHLERVVRRDAEIFRQAASTGHSPEAVSDELPRAQRSNGDEIWDGFYSALNSQEDINLGIHRSSRPSIQATRGSPAIPDNVEAPIKGLFKIDRRRRSEDSYDSIYTIEDPWTEKTRTKPGIASRIRNFFRRKTTAEIPQTLGSRSETSSSNYTL